VAVRENQPIFSIPDSSRMRVKARVNESRVAHITRGQPVEVVTDAFPDQPFRGRVAEVTVIPAPAGGPISDVKIYYAWVDIETDGFDELRPGMSAEVSFLQETRYQVTRVPVQAIRRVGSAAFVAVPAERGYRWQPVELGATNPAFAEVREGLKPGDRVVADPSVLPPPPGARPETAARLAGISSRS
jgi:multidrug efflux pump subunit AcrA (membrane-fusion protein)